MLSLYILGSTVTLVLVVIVIGFVWVKNSFKDEPPSYGSYLVDGKDKYWKFKKLKK